MSIPTTYGPSYNNILYYIETCNNNVLWSPFPSKYRHHLLQEYQRPVISLWLKISRISNLIIIMCYLQIQFCMFFPGSYVHGFTFKLAYTVWLQLHWVSTCLLLMLVLPQCVATGRFLQQLLVITFPDSGLSWVVQYVKLSSAKHIINRSGW